MRKEDLALLKTNKNQRHKEAVQFSVDPSERRLWSKTNLSYANGRCIETPRTDFLKYLTLLRSRYSYKLSPRCLRDIRIDHRLRHRAVEHNDWFA